MHSKCGRSEERDHDKSTPYDIFDSPGQYQNVPELKEPIPVEQYEAIDQRFCLSMFGMPAD